MKLLSILAALALCVVASAEPAAVVDPNNEVRACMELCCRDCLWRNGNGDDEQNDSVDSEVNVRTQSRVVSDRILGCCFLFVTVRGVCVCG